MTKLQTLTTLAVCAATFSISAQTIQVNKDNRTIAITTSGEAQAPANVAVVTVGFNAYGADHNQAYSEGSRVSNNIIKALHDFGVKAESIESVNQSLNAIDDTDKPRSAKGLHFTFSQSWRVTVPANGAADVLHAAITAGANDSGGIQWKLEDEDELEAEAAGKALTHAQGIAASMAKGLHTTLGPLIYASNQTPTRTFSEGGVSLQTAAAPMMKKSVNVKPLAISPEKILRSATVYAVFAIQ